MKTNILAVLLLLSSSVEASNNTPPVNYNNKEKKHSFLHARFLHSTLSDKHEHEIVRHAETSDPLSQCLSNIETVTNSFYSTLDNVGDWWLTFDEYNDNCEGFPDGDTLTCDLKSVFEERRYPEYCNQVGGEIYWINLRQCANPTSILGVELPYIDENGEETNARFKEIDMINFPFCAPKSCTIKIAQKYVTSVTLNFKESCPKDSKRRKEFAFKRFTNKAGKEKLRTRSCDWLAIQPPSKITKICKEAKFQIYKNGFLPASRMCSKTCWENDGYCIKEHPSAEFLYDWEISEDGKYVPTTRQCSEVAGLIEEYGFNAVCHPRHDYLDTKHGYGIYVCPESCAWWGCQNEN